MVIKAKNSCCRHWHWRESKNKPNYKTNWMSSFWENRTLFPKQTTPTSFKITCSLFTSPICDTSCTKAPRKLRTKTLSKFSGCTKYQAGWSTLETKVLYFVKGRGRSVTDFSALPSHTLDWLVWATLQAVIVLLFHNCQLQPKLRLWTSSPANGQGFSISSNLANTSTSNRKA